MAEQVKVEDLQVRAEDFRRAWPNALTLAIAEAGALVAECATVKESLIDTGEKVIKMAQLTNRHMALVQETLKETVGELMVHHVSLVQGQTDRILEQLTVQTTLLIDQVSYAKSDLHKAQTEFLDTLTLRQNDLNISMLQAEKTISEIKAARQALHIAVEVSKAPISPSKVKGFWASLFS